MSLDDLNITIDVIEEIEINVESDLENIELTLTSQPDVIVLAAGNIGQPGPEGPEGPIGPIGLIGPAGAEGAEGSEGPMGPEGPEGPQGIQGDTGAAGTAGAPGEKWFTGSGAPAGGLAGSVVGDWYIDSANGDYYEKTGASSWTVRGNLKGATGASGIRPATKVVSATGSGWTADYSCDGTADDVQLQAAHDALPATGGTILLSEGTFTLAATVNVTKDNVRFVGMGRQMTVIQRSADVTMFLFSGPSTADRSWYCGLFDLTLYGGGITEYSRTTPGLKLKHASKFTAERLKFWSLTCEATRMVEVWDSYFIDCFWEDCGGNNGARPAVHVLNFESPDSETFDSNNIWFTNCHWESFRDGALWLVGAAMRTNKHRLVNCKFESRKLRGPFIKLDNFIDVILINTNLGIGEFDSGYSTAVDGLIATNGAALQVRGGYWHTVANVAASVRSFIKIGSGVSHTKISDLYFEAATVNKPTVAAIDSNLSNDIGFENLRWWWNPGNGILFSVGAGTDNFVGLAYGPTIATDASRAKVFFIDITNTTAFTISNPTNALQGQRITYIIRNLAGAAHGAISWGTNFSRDASFGAIANTKRRTISFVCFDGIIWLQDGAASGDL